MGLRELLMRGNRSGRTFEEEMEKQKVDQIGHAAWGWATGLLPFLGWCVWGLWGCLIGLLLFGGSLAGWIIREKGQGKDGSHVPWDPWLDSIVWGGFLVLGAGMGLALVKLLPGIPWL